MITVQGALMLCKLCAISSLPFPRYCMKIGCLGISVVDVVSTVCVRRLCYCLVFRWLTCSSPDSDVIISSRICFMMDSYTDGEYWFCSNMDFAFCMLTWKCFHVLQALKILCTNPDMTDLLNLMGASAWKFKMRPVSVGFEYHVDETCGPLWITCMSRNSNLLSVSRSIVNDKLGCKALISASFWSAFACLISRKMSSM